MKFGNAENEPYNNDIDRLTPIGRVLRMLSIDEIPQLINILKGEMSFIGPRPLLTQYLELYSKEQMRRHNVLPGLSGLAQVNGRNTTTWEKRFYYDVFYVDNISFFLDFKIFLKTIKIIFSYKYNDNTKQKIPTYFDGNA